MHKREVGVFCDTSFFIRLLDKNDILHTNAKEYFKYFLENDYYLTISTIVIAEYCTGGDISELPLNNLQILPFNIKDAKLTGKFARTIFDRRNLINLGNRNIIPNDTKLFAQAENKDSIKYFISSDTESYKIYILLKENFNLRIEFIDINVNYKEFFGILLD